MASTFTPNFNYEEPAAGDYPNAWAPPLNANFTLLDGAMGATLTVPMTGSNVTLTLIQSTQYFTYVVTGALTANVQLIFPVTRNYTKVVANGTTGNFTLTVIVAGGAGVIIDQGTTALVGLNGTNAFFAHTGGSGGCPIGTSLVHRGFNIPASITGYWVFEFGQTISRTTYAACMVALTRTQNGTFTSGSPIITGVSNTAGFGLGQAIEGSGFVPSSTTISSVTASTVTMSQNASAGSPTTSPFTVFPYGNGDGISTFTLPDARGRATYGRDDQGGTAAGRITNAGSGIVGTTVGANGGGQTASLSTTNVPAHTHTQQGTFTSGAGTAHSHGAGSLLVGTAISGTNDGPATYFMTGINSTSGDLVGSALGGNNQYVKTVSAGSNFDLPVLASGTLTGTTATENTHTHSVTLSGNTDTGSGSGTPFGTMSPALLSNTIIRIL